MILSSCFSCTSKKLFKYFVYSLFSCPATNPGTIDIKDYSISLQVQKQRQTRTSEYSVIHPFIFIFSTSKCCCPKKKKRISEVSALSFISISVVWSSALYPGPGQEASQLPLSTAALWVIFHMKKFNLAKVFHRLMVLVCSYNALVGSGIAFCSQIFHS